MKKTSMELEQELNKTIQDYTYLQNHYPRFRRDDKKGFTLNPLPDEIKKEYDYLYSRINNLKININQAKMKEIKENNNAF